jgi:hypothetical protein
VKPLWVLEVLNCHFAFANGVEFHLDPLRWSLTILLYTNPLIKLIVLVFFQWKVGVTCGIHGMR